MRNVSIPPFASVSAAAPPAGPPPMTATLKFRLLSFGVVLEADTWNLITGLERVVVVVVGMAELRRRPVKVLKTTELIVVKGKGFESVSKERVNLECFCSKKEWIWLGI